MAVPKHINSKFAAVVFEDPVDNEIKIRTSATGSFSPSGLNESFLVTTLEVSDTAIKLPATPLANRNTMVIYNKSVDDTLYIGNSDVTADTAIGTTSGWEIDPLSYYAIDVTEDVEIYGRYPSGKSATIKVLEVA